MREKKRGIHKRILSIVLAVVMIVSSCVISPRSAQAAAWDPRESYKDLKLRFWEDEEPGIRFYMNAGLRYILETVKSPSVGSTFGEWSVMDLLRAKYTGMDYLNYVDISYYDDYIDRMEKYVYENISKSFDGRLHSAKSTEYSRFILAMSALGYDITNVGALTEQKETYDFIDHLSKSFSYALKQGINGPIWEVIAMNTGTAETGRYDFYKKPSGGYPSDYNNFGKMLDNILSREITQSDGTVGGWSLYNNRPDVDITGMALQALAPYYLEPELYEATGATKSYEELEKAVERGIYILSQMQEKNGGYDSWGSVNSESIVQVIVALTALDIDPKAEEVDLPAIGKTCSFVKEGSTVDGVFSDNMIDALLSFWSPGSGSSPEVGGFKHVTFGYDGGSGSGNGVNAMATDQAVYGLIAYDRWLTGQTSLYDMRDSDTNNYIWNDAISYTITYDGNTYTDSFDSAYSPYETVKLPVTPVNGEMELVGWNTKADGSGTMYLPNELLSMPEQDITLYAQYGKPEYPITWELNGGLLADGIVLPDVYRPSTDSFQLPTAEEITKPGYTFEGWFDNEDFKGTPVVEVEKGSYGDKSFYAKWITDWGPINKFYTLVNSWTTITLADKQSIKEARVIYDGMEQNQKDTVSPIMYRKLENAEAELARQEEMNKGVDRVIELIREIGSEITLDSEAAITEAREAYSELPRAARDLVLNYLDLVQAEKALADLKDIQDAADDVIAKINAIGGVDLDSKVRIETARAAYNALSTEQRELISEEIYQILTDAEAELETLETEQEAVNNVINAITALGEITSESYDAVEATRSAYDSLTYLQKQDVTNYDLLLNAEEELRKIEKNQADVQNVKDQIASLGEITIDSWDAVGRAKAAYLLLEDSLKTEFSQEEVDILDRAAAQINKLAEAEQTDEDWPKANEVMGMISSIGLVSLEKEEEIAEARNAISAEGMTPAAKAFVENYYSLVMCETQLQTLKESKEQAAHAEASILAIGEVTADSQEAIEQARYAYDSLSDKAKGFVQEETLQILLDSEAKFLQIINEIENAEDMVVVQPVIDAIESIGEVDLTKEDLIVAARTQYHTLNTKQKKLVSNYAQLEEAEHKLADLKASRKKVEEVIQKIQLIGEVTQDSKDEIYEARAAYESLTEEEKMQVGQENLDLLLKKEAELEKILNEYAAITNTIALIDDIGTVDLDKEIYIKSARKAYDSLTEEQKKQITNYEVLVEAEKQFEKILSEKKAVDALVSRIIILWNYVGEDAQKVTLSNRSQIESIRADINKLTQQQLSWFQAENAWVNFQEMEKELERLKGELLPAKVTLNRTQVTLDKGASFTLTATVSPDTAENKNVKWQSLDPSIVRVDAKGKLTAVSQGTVNVVATTEAEGKTAVCKVTVSYSGKWIKDGKGWWYQYNSGGYPRNGWSLVSGKYYYFDASGYMKTGWLSVGGKWYYLGSDGARKTGWQKVGASWYYLNNSGVMATGWLKLGNTWYYMNGSGAMLTNWQKIGGIWYYFNGSGAMLTNWQKIGGNWYYFNESGKMLTGWQIIGKTWYYMNGSGAMLTGWQKISGSWYYMNGSGAMLTGWQKISGSWYYMNGSGAMLTGWQKISGSWYYMNGSGKMLTGWQKIGGSWYYMNGSGAMASNTWIGNSYVNGSGVWVKSR
jgi:uncharacterized repeat protein (TIGR02543 family)